MKGKFAKIRTFCDFYVNFSNNSKRKIKTTKWPKMYHMLHTAMPTLKCFYIQIWNERLLNWCNRFEFFRCVYVVIWSISPSKSNVWLFSIECIAAFIVCFTLSTSIKFSHVWRAFQRIYFCNLRIYSLYLYLIDTLCFHFFHTQTQTHTHTWTPPQDNLMRLLLSVFLWTSIIFHNEFYLILFTLWFDLYPSYSIDGAAQIHRTWLVVHSSGQVNLNLTNFVCVFIVCLSLFECVSVYVCLS